MKKCLRCGKLGLFFYIAADGLCEKCAEKEKKLKAEEELSSAHEFIKRISSLFKDIEKNGARIPSSRSTLLWKDTQDVPYDRVQHLQEDCRQICDELSKWRDYPRFEDVFLEGCAQEPYSPNCYTHLFIPIGTLYGNKRLPIDFPERIHDLSERVNALDTALRLYGEYEYRTYRIVGSTYDNDDGTSRQGILSKIKRKAKPFQDKTEISLVKYPYQDEDAIAVYANRVQVGNISRRDLASSVLPRWDRYDGVEDFELIGSAGLYGMDIVVRFEKEH